VKAGKILNILQTKLAAVAMDIRRNDALSFSIATMLDHLSRLIQAKCFTDDLPPVQWSALRYLAHVESGKRTIGCLSEFSGVNHSSASRTVATLARKGLITIEPDGSNRRSRRLTLTQDGWSLLERDPLYVLASQVGSLSEHDRVMLHGLIETLVNRINTPPPRSDPDGKALPKNGDGHGRHAPDLRVRRRSSSWAIQINRHRYKVMQSSWYMHNAIICSCCVSIGVGEIRMDCWLRREISPRVGPSMPCGHTSGQDGGFSRPGPLSAWFRKNLWSGLGIDRGSSGSSVEDSGVRAGKSGVSHRITIPVNGYLIAF